MLYVLCKVLPSGSFGGGIFVFGVIFLTLCLYIYYRLLSFNLINIYNTMNDVLSPSDCSSKLTKLHQSNLFKIVNPVNLGEVNWMVRYKIVNGNSVTEVQLQNVAGLRDDQIETLVSQAARCSLLLGACILSSSSSNSLQFRVVSRAGSSATVSMS